MESSSIYYIIILHWLAPSYCILWPADCPKQWHHLAVTGEYTRVDIWLIKLRVIWKLDYSGPVKCMAARRNLDLMICNAFKEDEDVC